MLGPHLFIQVFWAIDITSISGANFFKSRYFFVLSQHIVQTCNQKGLGHNIGQTLFFVLFIFNVIMLWWGSKIWVSNYWFCLCVKLSFYSVFIMCDICCIKWIQVFGIVAQIKDYFAHNQYLNVTNTHCSCYYCLLVKLCH